MHESLKLNAPLEISRSDVERALQEQSKDVPAVSRVYDQLRGAAAERAADELNGALNIDVFTWLTQGWRSVGAVRDAMQRSVLSPGPPAIVKLDQHSLSSTSYLVLDTLIGSDGVLPELKLVLELFVGLPSATLAIKEGRIEVLALGEATFIARLKYKDAVLKKHVTGIDGAPKDPFHHKYVVARPEQGVDIYL